MTKRVLASLAAAGALLLTGCASDPANYSEPEPTPSTLGEVSTVAELKDAAVDAGYACPNWQQGNHVQRAAESGNCDEDDVFSTYLSTDARDETVQGLKDMFASYERESETTLLVGPNWVINSPEAADLEDALGGTLVTF